VADVDSLSKAYLQGSPDAVVIVDEGGSITFVNDRTKEMFGYEHPAQLVGESVEKLVPERFAAAHRAHRAGYRSAPTVRSMGEAGVELFGRRSDMTTFPVEISLSPIDTGGGQHVMASIRDVTARLRLEADVRRVGDALDAVHEAVFMFEPDSLRFVYVNEGAVEQVGYTRAELLGEMTPLDLKPDFTLESFRVLVRRLVTEERDALTFTTTHRRKDGSELAVEVVLQQPHTRGPLEDVLVALVRDVSERYAAQDRARADREALRVAEDRERIARDLHDLVIQRLFAAGMRLQAALGRPETLAARSDETVAELDETIAVIRRTIFELTDTAEVTVSSRIQKLADRHTDRTGVPVLVHLSGDIEGMDEAITAGLDASLTEALSNVARHAAAQSVTVSLTVDDHVTLRVADDGVGIPDDRSSVGQGIPNIGIRAEDLGGSLSIEAGTDGGTDLVWRVPATSPRGF
jgi:PAS domain S-box-containing protein